jgi:5'-AMP-activated protein kinase regulatory beta subunit
LQKITSPFYQGFEISGPSGTVEFSHSLLNPSQEDNFGAEENSPKVLPTVFKWDGGGKQVYITGTFSNWKTIPMVKR